eukprot:GHVU01026727.1.p1 GENE.GHVU01026727.1~~GHVU01026727.1.p1  ORF type:complete len:149 (+),score=10.56 GHVU01026727.1:308-754(+)
MCHCPSFPRTDGQPRHFFPFPHFLSVAISVSSPPSSMMSESKPSSDAGGGAKNEVPKLLEAIELPQYSKRLLDNGFDSIDLLREAGPEHWEAMKVPAGHQLKVGRWLSVRRALMIGRGGFLPVLSLLPPIGTPIAVATVAALWLFLLL